MIPFERVCRELSDSPRKWLVTGAAGFIGSNLVEALLELGQEVVGLDNFATGHRRNLEQALQGSSAETDRFRFVEGDICDPGTCAVACEGVSVVLHQAALGSVPRSIEDPLQTHRANVDGMMNMLLAAREADVDRFVFAASSSAYGDHPGLPKVEAEIGRPLSPYAATKRIGEIYLGVFQTTFGLSTIGLRYFNVFGRRQDPEGPYAAVIPRWIGRLLARRECEIYGDGETSRDFCYIDNVVQANVLAALAPREATDEIYNVATGQRTTLNELFGMVRDGLARRCPELADARPVYRDFRPGDVRHSLADIEKARTVLGYRPSHDVESGLLEALDWYAENLAQGRTVRT
ncbi:MAG: SDR family oxidoreductase [Gemmatimonadota bacterium]